MTKRIIGILSILAVIAFTASFFLTKVLTTKNTDTQTQTITHTLKNIFTKKSPILTFISTTVIDGVITLPDTVHFKTDDKTSFGPIAAEVTGTSPVRIVRDGIHFSFIDISASDTHEQSEKTLRDAKIENDVLIVYVRWNQKNPLSAIHTPAQEKKAHELIDMGADMIIGHDISLIQDSDEYNGHPIVYSVGTLVSRGPLSFDTMHSIALEATFEDTKKISLRKKIIELDHSYRPKRIYEETDEEYRDARTNARICAQPKKDFDDTLYTYLNVDQKIPLTDKEYTPSDLVKLDKDFTQSTICIRKEASEKLTLLIADAKKDGLALVVSSGFRDYVKQTFLITQNIKKKKTKKSTSVAKPGYSEHQLGLAVDLSSASIAFEGASQKFGDTPESTWLSLHAADYGFIQSYPKGKEDITGYIYEPWHYRYVGPDIARDVIASGMTLNQYLTNKKN